MIATGSIYQGSKIGLIWHVSLSQAILPWRGSNRSYKLLDFIIKNISTNQKCINLRIYIPLKIDDNPCKSSLITIQHSQKSNGHSL